VIFVSLVVCFATWFVIERTKLGSYLRAATENPTLVNAFGVNVPRMITLTYGFGVGLAALAGVMAAPIYNVSPQMGAELIIVLIIAPLYVYPGFLMKALCFAMFACAFNLLIGYVGLLSFGHALYFGWAAYLAAHVAKVGTLQVPIPFVHVWLTIPLPAASPEL